MIPKVIHYSWFSGEPMPEDIKAIMSSWKKRLPDYEFVLWDGPKLASLKIPFADEAVSVRKWAFAADVLRCYAVYTYGGIWLDTDVEVFKSFDPFLNEKMFIGTEAQYHHMTLMNGPREYYLTSHCFGAEKGHPFLKKCLEYYEGRHFITCKNKEMPEELKYDMQLLPQIHAILAEEYFGYCRYAPKAFSHQMLKYGIHVFPHYYFDVPKYAGMDNVVCIHRAFGSWKTKFYRNVEATNPQKKNLRYYCRKAINAIMHKLGFEVDFSCVWK